MYEKCNLGNDLSFVDELLQNMIEVLVEYASDDFWKVLKYGSKDALTNPLYTITIDDKIALVDSSSALPRIKTIPYNSTIAQEAHNEIRIYDSGWLCEDLSNYAVRIGFDVICHDSNILLDGGRRAHSLLRSELLKIFNNSRVDKNIGKLTADGLGFHLKLTTVS